MVDFTVGNMQNSLLKQKYDTLMPSVNDLIVAITDNNCNISNASNLENYIDGVVQNAVSMVMNGSEIILSSMNCLLRQMNYEEVPDIYSKLHYYIHRVINGTIIDGANDIFSQAGDLTSKSCNELENIVNSLFSHFGNIDGDLGILNHILNGLSDIFNILTGIIGITAAIVSCLPIDILPDSINTFMYTNPTASSIMSTVYNYQSNNIPVNIQDIVRNYVDSHHSVHSNLQSYLNQLDNLTWI